MTQFAFIADRKVFVDAYLVSTAENGCKAEFRKSTTICCGFYLDETTTYGGIFDPCNSFASAGYEKSPVFGPGM